MHYITHDMASDAENPDLEGMPMPEYTWDMCPDCNGTGIIDESSLN